MIGRSSSTNEVSIRLRQEIAPPNPGGGGGKILPAFQHVWRRPKIIELPMPGRCANGAARGPSARCELTLPSIKLACRCALRTVDAPTPSGWCARGRGCGCAFVHGFPASQAEERSALEPDLLGDLARLYPKSLQKVDANANKLGTETRLHTGHTPAQANNSNIHKHGDTQTHHDDTMTR